MASKKATKGKRYSAEEKQAVVNFVNEHNANSGRGGVTAAVKKYGVSALTIASWVKIGAASGSFAKVSRTKVGKASDGTRRKVLAELSKLDQEINTRRKELGVLESRFEKLKTRL